MLRSKKDGRTARGLSFLADDIVDRFHKVAISKHRVSQEEQTVIDDHFFRHSFVYPDFSSLDTGLQEFIAADLMDISLRASLEKSGELLQLQEVHMTTFRATLECNQSCRFWNAMKNAESAQNQPKLCF